MSETVRHAHSLSKQNGNSKNKLQGITKAAFIVLTQITEFVPHRWASLHLYTTGARASLIWHSCQQLLAGQRAWGVGTLGGYLWNQSLGSYAEDHMQGFTSWPPVRWCFVPHLHRHHLQSLRTSISGLVLAVWLFSYLLVCISESVSPSSSTNQIWVI